MASLPEGLGVSFAILSRAMLVLLLVGQATGAGGTSETGTCDADNGNSFQVPPGQSGLHGWDPVGLVALGSMLLSAALYLAACELKRRRAEASQAPLLRGAFRLAAARGEVQNLDLLWRLLGEEGLGSVDAVTASGFTALHAAAVGGHAEACLWLCKRGADVSALKDDGWLDSPLHLAAASGSLECCKVLLAFGADFKARNFAGHTPAGVAARNGYASLASWLEQPPAAAAADVPPVGLVPSGTKEPEQGMSSKERRAAEALLRRAWDGVGSEGALLTPATWAYRTFATLMLGFWLWYLVWRALFTLHKGWWYLYSIPMLAVEVYYWLDTIPAVLCIWNQIDRPERKLADLVKDSEEYPTVDVIVMCYTEPVEVIEPTVIAARNMNYPATKLAVYVCDDGGREDVKEMVARVHAAAGGPPLHYIGREKKPGVPHHAKAGSINSFLLKEGITHGSYVLVLDSDMVVHPEYLESCMGHFYERDLGGSWVLKRKCAFLQTPHDFWNITPSDDPIERAIRMYFGPIQKGKDGIGAATCCGSGVIFDRTALVSVGGQAYGTLTEDIMTGMDLSAVGLSSMYLNDRLVCGINTDDIKELLKQRHRWSTGLIQIIFRNNPLCHAGLTAMQRIQYFSDSTYPFAAVPFLFTCLVPLLYLFSKGAVSPIMVAPLPLWQTLLLLLAFYTLMELAVCCALAGDWPLGARATTERLISTQQTQQSYWVAPTHFRALWDVLKSETGLRRLFRAVHLEFLVTAKNLKPTKPEEAGRVATAWGAFRGSLAHLWPLLAYALLGLAAIIYWAASSFRGGVDIRYLVIPLMMVAWTLMILINLWPVLVTMLPGWGHPRGWKIMWLRKPSNSGDQPTAQPHPTPDSRPDFSMRPAQQGPRLAYVLGLLLRVGFLLMVALIAAGTVENAGQCIGAM